jgi:hypothetical protein
VVVLLTSLLGCDQAGHSATEKKPTKAEWRAKFANSFGQTASMGIVDNLTGSIQAGHGGAEKKPDNWTPRVRDGWPARMLMNSTAS